MATLRSRNGVILIKNETTSGTDAAPTTTNAILVENPRLSFDPGLIETNELTGSLDPRAPIPGGLKASLTFDTYIKGSGSAGTAPEFGDLFKACGFEEVVFAGISAEAASSGDASSLVLGASATTAAQTYRGMPLVFSANPSAGIAFITDYTAGKLASLARSHSPALSSTTEYAIPANVLYKPTSVQASIKSNTAYLYMDGVLYKLLGARGSPSLNVGAGGVGRLSWSFTGMYGGKSDAAVPSVAAFDSTRPPVWRNPDGYSGAMLIGGAQAALSSFTFGPNNNLVYPPNPNAAEGFDPTEIVSRRMSGTMDPQAALVATRDIMADFRAATPRSLNLHYGTVAGNRFGLTIPAAQYISYQPGDREGLMTEEVGFFASGEDAGGFFCFF